MESKPTRYYSKRQEDRVAEMLGGNATSNSGAYHFDKGDVVVKEASLLIECKTSMKDKSSFSIKEDWLTKNQQELFGSRLSHSCVAINFGPDKPNYFLINEGLMGYLVDSLRKDNL